MCCCSRRTSGTGWCRPPGRFSLTPCRRRFSIYRCGFLSIAAGPLTTVSNRLGWFARILNRQAARTVHFGVLWWFLLFIFVHVTLVFITGARQNLNYMFAGVNDSSWKGLLVFSLGLVKQ